MLKAKLANFAENNIEIPNDSVSDFTSQNKLESLNSKQKF